MASFRHEPDELGSQILHRLGRWLSSALVFADQRDDLHGFAYGQWDAGFAMIGGALLKTP
jgi:hypothetical protein